MHPRRQARTTPALLLALALLAVAALAPTPATAAEEVEVVAEIAFEGATEIDFDGRYAYVGQFNGKYDRQTVREGQQGGLRVIDLVGDDETAQFDQVAYLNCPGTDNYVRSLDPAVYSPEEGRQFVVMAHHGNQCTRLPLLRDPNSTNSYGARNGIAIVDVTDRENPAIVDVIGHYSAHTVMPHPTRPYLFILPGGLANGTGRYVSPTGIIDATDPTNLVYKKAFEHNAAGCHDLGFTADGNTAYCAGFGEVQVWDLTGDRITSPEVVGTVVNPAIQFAHNAVVSPDGKYMLVNDEAFGFHTCEGAAADLYGSLWIYDISINPHVPVLAGRISPPAIPDHTPKPLSWVAGWCAAHNYNFVPGTSIVVASWFAGGMTAHDISNPLIPELVASYRPEGESVMWTAHYFGGYVLTGDMARGVDILDIPALREAEAAGEAGAAAAGGTAAAAPSTTSLLSLDQQAAARARLIPAVLPPRPARPAGTTEGGFCVLPGRLA